MKEYTVPHYAGISTAAGTPLPKESAAQEAQRVVNGVRGNDYGSARDNMQLTADIWSAILQHKVTAEEVALCMIGVKIARELHTHKHDNLVDICGYTLVLEKLYEEPVCNSTPDKQRVKHDGF